MSLRGIWWIRGLSLVLAFSGMAIGAQEIAVTSFAGPPAEARVKGEVECVGLACGSYESETPFPAESLLSGRFQLDLGGRLEAFNVLRREWNLDGSITTYVSAEGSNVAFPVTEKFGMIRGAFNSGDGRVYELAFRAGEYALRLQRQGDFQCLTAVPPKPESFQDWIPRTTTGTTEETSSASAKRRSVASGRPIIAKLLVTQCAGSATEFPSGEFSLSASHIVSLLNATLMNSGLPWAKVELAGIASVECPKDPETGQIQKYQDILRWAWKDAYMDSVRRQYAADLTLIIKKSDEAVAGVGGIAWRPFPGYPMPSTGFAVVSTSRVDNYSEWAALHEVLHNLGGEHNPEDATTPIADDPAPYAREYYRCGANGARGALTLSYPRCNPDVPVIPYVSNPAVIWNGAAFGVPDYQDNARVMKAIFPLVAQYVQ